MQEIFAKVGRKYGYDEVKADYTPFRDFKVKWMRSYKWINFDVSDYLKNAPENVLEGVADTLFGKIKGENTAYPVDVIDWLTSPEFVEQNQPIYMRRCRGLSNDCTGYNHDLFEAYERLVAKGLVKYDRDIVFRWGANHTTSVSRGKVGHSSVLMKTVVISENLDSKDVSEDMLDFAVYSQVVFVGMGFNANGEPRGAKYEALLDQYPDREAVEGEIRDMLGLSL